jgi:hypothetical protein
MRIVDRVDLAELALLRLKVPLPWRRGARARGTCSPTGASATRSAELVLQGRPGFYDGPGPHICCVGSRHGGVGPSFRWERRPSMCGR